MKPVPTKRVRQRRRDSAPPDGTGGVVVAPVRPPRNAPAPRAAVYSSPVTTLTMHAGLDGAVDLRADRDGVRPDART
ncbi:MAG: hypothetical protein WKF83_04155 [Nocardioidaceae bacterium]